MILRDLTCHECGAKWEALVSHDEPLTCACGSHRVGLLMSAPMVRPQGLSPERKVRGKPGSSRERKDAYSRGLDATDYLAERLVKHGTTEQIQAFTGGAKSSLTSSEARDIAAKVGREQEAKAA